LLQEAIVDFLDGYCDSTRKPKIEVSPTAQAQLDNAVSNIPQKIREMNPHMGWGINKEPNMGLVGNIKENKFNSVVKQSPTASLY